MARIMDGAAAEAGFFDTGLAAEVAWFGAEVAPGSRVRHAALRLPGPLGMVRRKRLAVSLMVPASAFLAYIVFFFNRHRMHSS